MDNAGDALLFKIEDPRGRTVICTERCWYEHVLARRSWMTGWENEVIETIQNPSYGIYQDPHFDNRCIYYRRQTSKARYLKVVVEVHEHNPDRVITAFVTDSMKRGEAWIWPKND